MLPKGERNRVGLRSLEIKRSLIPKHRGSME